MELVKKLRYIIAVATAGGILLCSYLMLKITLPYLSFRYDVDFLLTKQPVLHITAWRWAFYVHIFSSLFVLLFGLFQFVPALLRGYKKLHRFLGKVYVVLVLFLSAPGGLVMAFYANGGFWSKASFVVVSVLWWCFTFMAYQRIKSGNIQQHTDFMARSYALTLSAIALRVYVVVLPHFVHLHAKEMYTLVAWLSWVPNLLLAEWIIKSKVFK